jgi:tetratricopeptide (TPR) repeat protein
MAVNPYAPCPCGSGKKFKFCCQDVVADLQRINSLSRNQPEVALNAIQQLAVKHPDRESVLRELVVMLLRFNRVQEALKACTDFLKAHPDNPSTLLIYADILLQATGFDSSRRIVHRAFQVCTRQFPKEISQIATRVAGEFLSRDLIPAAREHALFALRLANSEEQTTASVLFERIEAATVVPFLLRTSWPLLNFEAAPEILQQHERALRLCRLGCWEPAAIIYNRLADQTPLNSAVWYNLGLCQMWDGRHAEAASSLHHAAVLSTDFEEAAEFEALAQVLDPKLYENHHSIQSVKLSVRAVSEVVSRIENHPLIRNTKSHDHSNCSHDAGASHAGEFMLTSMPSPSAQDATADNVAQYLADIDVYSIDDPDAAAEEGNQHPWIEVTCSSQVLDQVIVTLRDCVGDLIITAADEEQRNSARSCPEFSQPLEVRPVRPLDISQADFERISDELEARAIEACLHKPCSVLNGKSIVEAAADPQLHRQAAAAVTVLQALGFVAEIPIDVDDVRARLNLPARAPLPAAAAENAAALSVLALARLPIQELSDQQLRAVIGRCTGSGVRKTLTQALDECISRGDASLGSDAMGIFITRANIARGDDDRELCFTFIEKARQAAETRPDAFRTKLEIDIRELAWRLESPGDPHIRTLLHRIRDLYLHKIPELMELIKEQLTDAGCADLIPEVTPANNPAQSASIWTPGAASAAPAPAASSLWLPGQS